MLCPQKESTSRLAAFAKESEAQFRNSLPGESYGRFVILDRTRYDLSDTVTVLGCTSGPASTPSMSPS